MDCGTAVRVVAGEQSNLEQYAALSYCWAQNPNPQFMLLRTNQSRYADGVPIADLNNVFQDAISVCQGLSTRYLWIDALCIVQGAGGDFESEASRVREIYAGSSSTIVAASSSDPTRHFLVERDPRPWISCKLSKAWINNTVKGCSNTHNSPSNMTVDTRGWYLQERCLSPRSIYFADRGVHWECREGIACEDHPKIRDHRYYASDKYETLNTRYWDLLSFDSSLGGPAVASSIRRLWWSILPSYLTTNLSHQEDRLIIQDQRGVWPLERIDHT